MTNVDDFIAQSEIQGARDQLTDAYLNPETPEQTAKRFQKARVFELPPSQVEAVTPEEEAARRAADVDWAAMYAQAPILTGRMADPAFANLVKEDIANASMTESLIWQMAPETGQKDTVWGAVRNAFTRGGYAGVSTLPIAGPQSELGALSKELDGIETLEADIAAGKDVSARFATAEEPTGQLGLKAFLADKDRIKNNLLTRMTNASEQIARLQRMQAYFPSPKEVQEFMQAEGLGQSLKLLAENPLMIMADLGVSSMTQQAPALFATAVTGGAGLMTQMGTMGAFSFGLDRNASMQQNLQEMGVDLTDPEQIMDAMRNPEKREQVARAADRANRHALGTALFDAASIGLAGKVLLPKSITQRLADSVYKREFANMGVQMVVQGAMGGAGEAAGQLLSDGEISSWSDIVAEVIGEQFTAPIEVMTTGMRARHDVQVARQKAELSARAAQQLGQVIQQSSVNALDPETMSDQVQRVAKASGVETVSIDAQSFHQKGLDRKFGDIPEVAEQLEQAAETGGDIKIPFSVYAQRIAPQDADGAVASIASFAGLPSLTEVQEQAQATEQAIAIHATESVAASTPTFRRELADVGREIGSMIRRTGATKSEAKALQAIIQTHVANMAHALGVSPTAIWNAYGAQIMGEPQVQRDSEGNLVSMDGELVSGHQGLEMGSPIWQGDLNSFIGNDKQFGRYIAERNVAGQAQNFLGASKAEVQITRDAARHVKNDHPDFSDADFVAVEQILDNPSGGYVNGDRVVLFSRQPDGSYLAAVFKPSKSARRDREGGSSLRLSLVTAYKTDENTFLSQLKKKQTEHPGMGGELPSDPTFIGSLNQSALSDTSLPQGEFFPLLRLIARWRNADRSTLLHESAHLFLDMRITALRDLMESGAPLNPQQQAFVEHMQAVFDWLQIPDVDAWYNLTFEEQRKYQEKFARSFEAYVMEGRAPVSSLKNAFRSFASWL